MVEYPTALGDLVIILAVLVNMVACSTVMRSTESPSTKARIIGYFTSWGINQPGRPYRVKEIVDSGAAERLTVINYAFANVLPQDDGRGNSHIQCAIGDSWADYQKPFSAEESFDGLADTQDQQLRGNFNQLKKLKAKYPNLKVIISLGGWTWSGHFSDAALTSESREVFIKSCIDLFIKGDLPSDSGAGVIPGLGAGVFDGIDVDWEYPASPGAVGNIYRPEDTKNFSALLAEFRRQLDKIDPNLLLTIAAPAGTDKYHKIELDKVHHYLDWINLMTYDFHGSWDVNGPTNFHSNLFTTSDDPYHLPFSVDSTVQGYLDMGVPPAKIVVGVPFYGRGWTGVVEERNGLYQPAVGPVEVDDGYASFHILNEFTEKGYTRFWDEEAQAAWLFNGETFWTYEDEESINKKMDYVRSRNLSGVMFWSLDGDDQDATLVSTIYECLSLER